MKSIFAVLGFLLSCNAFAGGSISREAAIKEICDEASNLCEILKAVSLEPTGSAVRRKDGSRRMPYEFNAEINGDATWVVMRRDEKGHIVLELR